jgi:hypothetical protein
MSAAAPKHISCRLVSPNSTLDVALAEVPSTECEEQ